MYKINQEELKKMSVDLFTNLFHSEWKEHSYDGVSSAFMDDMARNARLAIGGSMAFFYEWENNVSKLEVLEERETELRHNPGDEQND